MNPAGARKRKTRRNPRPAASLAATLPDLSGLPRDEKLPDGFHIGHHKMIVEHIKGYMRKIEASLDEHMAALDAIETTHRFVNPPFMGAGVARNSARYSW